jgi:hypothetical protein
MLENKISRIRNHREEIELALAGGTPDCVPFTFYDLLFPEGFDPAPLQSKGMALCARRPVYRKVTPNVKVREVKESDGGVRTIYNTPVGTLTSLYQPAALAYGVVGSLDRRGVPIVPQDPQECGMPSWPIGAQLLERPIKTRDDYRVAKFIVEDTRYEQDYDTFLAECERIGNAGKVIAHTCYEPLLDVEISWLGQERFCYEVADNSDAVMELHEALAENHKKMYEVVASSPADYVLYGGNVVPEMLGPDRVRDYVCPCWNAFADRLHERGKKIGVHLDANNRLILDVVRNSKLDFVEAFTPPPDCNVSVAEARAAWPGKRLWINFPSSVHIQSEDTIREATLEIYRQAGDRKGFLMGVTEDIPREHIERSVTVILDTLKECGV